MMIRLAAILLGVALFAPSTAQALDPICDASDPGYLPHDLAKPYVRLSRDIRFCSSWTAELQAGFDAGTLALRCVAKVNGVGYASEIGAAPGVVISLADPNAPNGSLSILCHLVDPEDPTTPLLTSPEAVTQYVPEPGVPAPVPLP